MGEKEKMNEDVRKKLDTMMLSSTLDAPDLSYISQIK